MIFHDSSDSESCLETVLYVKKRLNLNNHLERAYGIDLKDGIPYIHSKFTGENKHVRRLQRDENFRSNLICNFIRRV